jgi:RNA polymerase sigma factor (sigma-70 family)
MTAVAGRERDGLPVIDLVMRPRNNDKQAWDALVERYAPLIWSICRRYGLSGADADDVGQTVWLHLVDQLDRLRDPAALRPWIAQLTRRTCLDRLRAGSREVPEEDIEPEGFDEQLEALDEALAVRHALEGVGEMCREMLDRFFARDESYRTIGEALELPAGTIASRISRCLDKLRAAMEDSEPVSRPVDR